jgi:hypothetical protein
MPAGDKQNGWELLMQQVGNLINKVSDMQQVVSPIPVQLDRLRLDIQELEALHRQEQRETAQAIKDARKDTGDLRERLTEAEKQWIKEFNQMIVNLEKLKTTGRNAFIIVCGAWSIMSALFVVWIGSKL